MKSHVCRLPGGETGQKALKSVEALIDRVEGVLHGCRNSGGEGNVLVAA